MAVAAGAHSNRSSLVSRNPSRSGARLGFVVVCCAVLLLLFTLVDRRANSYTSPPVTRSNDAHRLPVAVRSDPLRRDDDDSTALGTIHTEPVSTRGHPDRRVKAEEVPLLEFGRLATVVLTHRGTMRKRVGALMRTWGRDVNIRFIATDSSTIEGSNDGDQQLEDSVTGELLEVLPQFNGLESLGKKVMHAWGMLCDDPSFTGHEAIDDDHGRSMKSSGHERKDDASGTKRRPRPLPTTTDGDPVRADWFMMVDDDTFIVVDNLRALLASLDPTKGFYGGYVLNHKLDGPFVGGGGGVILSRPTLSRLCRAREDDNSLCSLDKAQGDAGDIATVECMDELKVKPTHIEGMMPFAVGNHLNGSDCRQSWWYPATHLPCDPPDQIISMHYVRPEDVPLYHYALNRHVRAGAKRWSPPKVLKRFGGPSREQVAYQKRALRERELNEAAKRAGGSVVIPSPP